MSVGLRFLGTVLSLALAFGPAIPALASGTDGEAIEGFADVSESDSNHPYIQFAVEKGWISPLSATTFGPDHTYSRAEAVGVAIKISGLTKSAAEQGGMLDRFTGPVYQPNAALTRAELAVLAVRATRQPTGCFLRRANRKMRRRA